MTAQPTLVYGVTLPPEAIAVLAAKGLLPGLHLPQPKPSAAAAQLTPTPPAPSHQALNPLQKQIYEALTYRPLNENQVQLISIYLAAAKANEGPLSVFDSGGRLAKATGHSHGKAEELVKGALRAFGKRLFKKLKKIPLKHGKDKYGEGVADEIPLLAFVSITKGSDGGACHQLTADGVIVAELLISMSDLELPAAGATEITVTVEIKASTEALLKQLQEALGMSLDDVLHHLALQAGVQPV
ncbi:hypothetical protein BSY19_5373 (plasmid) [Bosea sp. RAC05]|nr:hypothetical protein BSY19_5373 [Bosea sp. RAC05]